MSPSHSSFQTFLAELRRRRVIRAVLAYGAGVFGLVQVADPIFAGLMLPDLAFRVLVLISVAGFPVVAILAWIYELTAEGLKRTDMGSAAPAVRVPLARKLQLVGAFTIAALLVVVTAGAVGRLRYPPSDDGRVGLAIFPFRAASSGPEWSEGAADLLATALDGTASLRVVDPWPLWRPLRDGSDGPAAAPDVEAAVELARRVGAHRFLLGSVVPAGDRVEVALRLYQVGRVEPIDVFTVGVAVDRVQEFVRGAAVRVLARLWGARRPADVPAELDFDATGSPEALKAYLAAKEALRRGMIDSANVAIDRAIELDSTFVLAIVEAVTIKSWGFFMRGQPYAGFFELLDRAEPFESNLSERTRLRLEAMRASVRTDGRAAINAAMRILDIDPTDFDASSSLSYFERTYGWQLAPPPLDGRASAERVVQLDSAYVPALASRAWWAVALDDTADQRLQLGRLLRADSTSSVARGHIAGLRALLATDPAYAAMIDSLAALPTVERLAAHRYLRVARPDRFGRLLEAMRRVADPLTVATARGEGMRLDVSSGYSARADSMIRAGAFAQNDFFRTAQRFLIAADLAGVGDSAAARAAADALAAYVPHDSARAYFETRPVWWTGWVLGAWHAQAGDSAEARRWMRTIGTLPPGGTSEDYRGSLQADIEARLLARRGDLEAALGLAKTAYRLWAIHTENQPEALPEPAMRFHLALLHRATGQPDSARALLASLVPPATWMGFLTARASYELGDLEQERGDMAAAAFHFRRALRMWQDAGPSARVWKQRTEERLASLGLR